MAARISMYPLRSSVMIPPAAAIFFVRDGRGVVVSDMAMREKQLLPERDENAVENLPHEQKADEADE